MKNNKRYIFTSFFFFTRAKFDASRMLSG